MVPPVVPPPVVLPPVVPPLVVLPPTGAGAPPPTAPVVVVGRTVAADGVTLASNNIAIQQTQQTQNVQPRLTPQGATPSTPAGASFTTGGPLANLVVNVFAEPFTLATSLGQLAPAAGGPPTQGDNETDDQAANTLETPESRLMTILRDFWLVDSATQ